MAEPITSMTGDSSAPSTLDGGKTYLDTLADDDADHKAKTQELTDTLAGQTATKIAQEGKISKDMEYDMRRYAGITEQAREATSASMGAIPGPWNAEQEREKFSTSPLAAFGSAASVFGILASTFTHAPMMNALNASAAAMNAIKSGDDAAYDKAYTAWKANTDLAIKRTTMMRENYHDALELLKVQPEIARARLTALATQYQDQATLAFLNAGMDERIIDIDSKRAQNLDHLQKAAIDNERLHALRSLQQARKSGDPDAIQKAQQNLQDVIEAQGYGTRGAGTPLQQLQVQAIRELQDAEASGDPDRIAKAKKNVDDLNSVTHPAKPATPLQQEQKDAIEYLKSKGMDPDMAYNQIVHPSAVLAKPGTEGSFTNLVTPFIKQQHPGWSDADVAREATRQWVQDHTKTPQLKAGSQEEYIETRKAELLRENAQQRAQAQQAMDTGEEAEAVVPLTESAAHAQALRDYANAKNVRPVADNPQAERSYAELVYDGKLAQPSSWYLRTHPMFADTIKQIEQERGAPFQPGKYQADVAAAKLEATAESRSLADQLKAIGGNKAATKAFGDFVALNGANLIKTAEKLGLDGTTAVQKYALYGQRALGDPDVADYFFQLQTFQTEAARIITNPRLVGQLTDTARREIQGAMPSAPNVETLRAILERVRIDTANRDKTLTDEENRIKAQLHSRDAQPAGATSVPDPLGIR